MAEVVQIPGDLGVRLVPGDELNFAVNLGMDVTGYTFTSLIYRATATGAGGGSVNTIYGVGTTVTAPVISIVSPTAGAVMVGMNETQTALLTPGGNYRWFLRWVAPGDITRTILGGTVTSVAP